MRTAAGEGEQEIAQRRAEIGKQLRVQKASRGVEHRRVAVLPALYGIGEKLRGNGGGRHAPQPEAGGNKHVRHGGAVAPDIGDVIQRYAVLIRPTADLGRVGEMRADEIGDRRKARALSARAVTPAADQKEIAVVAEIEAAARVARRPRQCTRGRARPQTR